MNFERPVDQKLQPSDRAIEQDFKAALRSGRQVYGTWVTSTFPKSIDGIAGLGLDYVFIDTEHVPLDWNELGWMCRAYRGMGVVPIVRIPNAEPFNACRVLDSGASGLVAAYVETAEEVIRMRGAVKYRPLKGRKLADFLSGHRPLEPQLAEYLRKANENNILLVNIESVAAVEALDEILAVPDLDGVLIGPHDLSCSLGRPEEYEHPAFVEMVQEIINKTRAKHLGVGIANLPELAQDLAWAKAGANIFLRLGDVSLFHRALQEDFSRLRKGLSDHSQPKSRTRTR